MKWLVACFLLIFGLSGCASKNEAVTNFHPIIDSNGADPWVFKKEDTYYYTKTTGNNVTLWKSDQLTTVAFGDSKVIWEMPGEFESAWAPELHFAYDKWVVYVALNRSGETHRMYALINESEDPFEGEWQLQAMKGMTDHFAIDGTVLTLGDAHYYLWSGWEGYENIAQNLYIAKMDSPYEISSQRQLLSKPEFDWEKMQKPFVNEGPQIFLTDGIVNLVYSASGSWDDDYALGLLSMKLGEDPLIASNWKKSAEPIFSKTESVFGPGHNGFVLDDKGQPWLIYHAARWSHSGWERSIRLQPLSLKDGKIEKMTPVSNGGRQTLPSGDAKRWVYPAKDAQYTKTLRYLDDGVVGFSDTTEEIKFSIDAPQEDDYTVLLYVKTVDNYDPQNSIQSAMTVNGEESKHLIFPSDYYQPIGLKTHLKKGKNKVTFRLEIGIDEVNVSALEIIESTVK